MSRNYNEKWQFWQLGAFIDGYVVFWLDVMHSSSYTKKEVETMKIIARYSSGDDINGSSAIELEKVLSKATGTSMPIFFMSLTEVFGIEQPPPIGSQITFPNPLEGLNFEGFDDPAKGSIIFKVEGVEYNKDYFGIAFVDVVEWSFNVSVANATGFFMHKWKHVKDFL